MNYPQYAPQPSLLDTFTSGVFGNILSIALVLLALAIIWNCFVTVNQQTIAVVETFGRFTRTLGPGLNFIFFPFQTIAGRVSLRIEPVHAAVSIKTTDNQIIELPVTLMVQALEARADDAFYKLREPHDQIRDWVLNSVRTAAAEMDVNAMFKDRSTIVTKVTNELATRMSVFGYRLDALLIDQPTLAPAVQEAFNEVIASQREKEAAENKAQAAKITTVMQAEAEAEAQKRRAEGLAAARKTLAEGLQAQLTAFTEMSGVSHADVMALLTEMTRIDAMRDVGRHGNLVLLSMGQDGAQGANTQAALLPLLHEMRQHMQAALPHGKLTAETPLVANSAQSA